MEIPDAQCHPFRHRRADGGRPDPAGGDAARCRLAHASRATPSAGVDQPDRAPAAGHRFSGPAAPEPSDGLLRQRRRDAMTPEQKRLVRDTWKQVAPVADGAAGMFYHRLFEIDPTTRKLFRATDMVAQRKKLLQTLAFAIGGLDHLDALASKVEDLGRRHARYGVSDAQYDSVGAALLWTLEQGLGHAWTPAVASAWTEVYQLLSRIMRKAVAQANVAPQQRVAVG